jgi:hypothetical protein
VGFYGDLNFPPIKKCVDSIENGAFYKFIAKSFEKLNTVKSGYLGHKIDLLYIRVKRISNIFEKSRVLGSENEG